jgi:hypothetical protein
VLYLLYTRMLAQSLPCSDRVEPRLLCSIFSFLC